MTKIIVLHDEVSFNTAKIDIYTVKDDTDIEEFLFETHNYSQNNITWITANSVDVKYI